MTTITGVIWPVAGSVQSVRATIAVDDGRDRPSSAPASSTFALGARATRRAAIPFTAAARRCARRNGTCPVRLVAHITSPDGARHRMVRRWRLTRNGTLIRATAG